MKGTMTTTVRIATITTIVLAVVSFGIYLGTFQVEAQDVTHLSSLTLSDDLTVGDDCTITGDLTVSGSVNCSGSTFNPGITLGAAAVTGTITSPFTPTGGTDTFFAMASSGAAAAGDILLAIGDSGDSTEFTVFGDGNVTADGTVTGAAGAFTGASGVALGGATTTGLISSAFTATGGADVALSADVTADLAAADTAFRVRDNGTSTLWSVDGTGIETASGAAFTGSTGVALGAAAVTGVISSPFTATGGADVALSADVTADLAAADSAFRVRDNATTVLASIGGTGILDTTGGITCSGTGALGWAVVDTADNAACTTGCTSAAVFGIDLAGGATAPVIVDASSATADVCLCAGAS